MTQFLLYLLLSGSYLCLLLPLVRLRIVSASPKWTPGEQDGKPVAVTYTYPVIYQLR